MLSIVTADRCTVDVARIVVHPDMHNALPHSCHTDQPRRIRNVSGPCPDLLLGPTGISSEPRPDLIRTPRSTGRVAM